MKRILIAAVVFIAPCWAGAQQSMPGMDMGGPQKPAPQQQQPMPGMDMGKPGKRPSPMQMPKDMQKPAPGDTPADQETQSLQNSQQQQAGQGRIQPGPSSDVESVAHDALTLQEPENEAYITGQSLPAPELLGDVVKRPPMSVDDFVAMAAKSNPTLDQARAFVRRSHEQGRQAGMYPNPVIGYSGDHIRGGDYGGGEQGAFVQQEFVLGGKLGLRRNIYEQQAQADQIGVDEQNYRVKDSVQQAFYRALTSQGLVVIRQRLMKIALDAARTAHQLANVGQADAPDVLQSEVELEQAKVDFEHAQRAYLRDFQTLAAVAGAQTLPVSPLKGDLEQPPALDAEVQVGVIVARSPTIKHAQQQVAVAEARLKDARREPFPNLSVKAGEWYSGEVIESGAPHPAGPESFAEAGVNVPLWNRNQGNVEAAKAELERARGDVTRTQLYLKQMAEPMAQQYLSSRFEADRYRNQMLPRARRAYELYLMKYQQMAAAYPQVLVSQRTLFDLQVNYLEALNMEWANALALENYTLMYGLDQPMSMGSSTTTINLPDGGGSE